MGDSVGHCQQEKKIYEYACHEGNHSVTGSLGGARRHDYDAMIEHAQGNNPE